jgi:hypothetical protein
MQIKQTALILFLFPALAFSQNTYLSQAAKENILIERLEILGQNDSILNFSKNRPWNRLQIVRGASSFKQNHPNIILTKTDEYNLQSLYQNNIEYLSTEQRDAIKSKKTIGRFYRTPANLYEVHVRILTLSSIPSYSFNT